MAAKQVDSSLSLQLNAGGLSTWSPNLILNGEDLGSSRAVDHIISSERHYQHKCGDPRENDNIIISQGRGVSRGSEVRRLVMLPPSQGKWLH